MKLTKLFKSKLVINISFLAIFQIANYIIPLILIPFIINNIGIEKFGIITFAQSFIQVFILIVNFGFHYTASKEIAENRHNLDILNEIYSNVFFTKLFLFIIASITFSLFVYFVPEIKIYSKIFILTYLITIGWLFLPLWIFQGHEDLAYLAILNFFIKLFAALLIVVLITNNYSYYFIPLNYSLAQIIGGLISFILAKKKYQIKLSLPTLKSIIKTIKKSYNIFLSTILINSYTFFSVFIMGLFSDKVSVGNFATAIKIIFIFQSLLIFPVSQSYFPRIAFNIKKSTKEAMKSIYQSSSLLLFGGLVMAILLFLSTFFIDNFISQNVERIKILLIILSFIPLVSGISNLTGVQCLINFNKEKLFLIINFLAAVFNFILISLIVPRYGDIGMALIWLSIEMFVASSFLLVLKNKFNINILNIKEAIKELL